jgi:N-dimethylarginine dimethylaminohydrolase
MVMLKNKYGLNSNVKKLKNVILKHPKDAFKSQSNIDGQWEELNFIAKPDYKIALKQYDKLLNILDDNNVSMNFLPSDKETFLDSIYTHDPMFMTPDGAIIGNMGKQFRKKETDMIEEYLINNNIPILGKIKNNGTMEGGDVIWINKSTVAVGLTYRTNREGINQLENILSKISITLIKVDLPHWSGPTDVLHLMSLISPLKDKLFLIYEKLIPISFLNFLRSIDINFIHIEESEYETLACNVLPLSEDKCLIVKGNPKTRSIIEKSGIETLEIDASEICYKGSGGPTCITRPIQRDLII